VPRQSLNNDVQYVCNTVTFVIVV